ncbi:hypothetical protein [Paenibacillus lemnae]|uniref:Uncharacterized protein n=1 Tax=Paenibacillus lemnae TaxID=1330551 RepID=A0A848MA61_PAELE|nr:hypothetical protein [Paenibacillus lemnae]NMO98138.1 hypothetical protein [Paenibacillus lemnae]
MDSEKNRYNNSRMDTGFYAWNKLAGAGMAVLLLTILSWLWPQAAGQSGKILGVSIPMEHWIYGYGLSASLAADAVVSCFPRVGRMKQAALYGAAGFLCFALLTGGSTDTVWVRGAAGILMLMVFWWSRRVLFHHSLMMICLALFVPLFCLL